ncbi:hypothetical protein F4815DRAFT_230247 [Daldinia loculata]|nr:hypothetical protein F4815DRAFT_230247 [Daldinia loculata]
MVAGQAAHPSSIPNFWGPRLLAPFSQRLPRGYIHTYIHTYIHGRICRYCMYGLRITDFTGIAHIVHAYCQNVGNVWGFSFSFFSFFFFFLLSLWCAYCIASHPNATDVAIPYLISYTYASFTTRLFKLLTFVLSSKKAYFYINAFFLCICSHFHKSRNM